MSTWINKIPLAATLLGVAACLPAAEGPGARSGREGPPPSRMAVAGGEIVIAGPKGFCIDRAASRDQGGQRGLSVLSSCRVLGAPGHGPDPAAKVVLTAVVAAQPGEILVGPAAPDLTRFFQSSRGRAALSRSGRAATVTLKETATDRDAYLMYLTDTAGFAWGRVQPDYWRALLPLGGRMVTLSVLGLPDGPIGRDEGLELLRGFIAATQNATHSATQGASKHAKIAIPVADSTADSPPAALAD